MRVVLSSMVAATLLGGAPALAQDAMKSDAMKAKPMSAADTKKMKSCQAMSHDKMMKDAGCAKLMKEHPDMMKHGAMTSHGG